MDAVIRFLLLHRRALAAVLAGLAVWSAIAAVTRSPDTREVLVAAHDLDSGAIVASADIAVQRLPRASVPDGAIEAGAAAGRALSGGMRAGEVFTDRRVVDPRDLGRGRVLAVVEVAAATGELLRSGDAVDVIAVEADDVARPVAEAVEVVIARTDLDRGAAVLGLAASPDVAAELARASAASRLAAVVVSRQ